MIDSFSGRHGYTAHLPERVLVEQDSPRLRALVWAIASNDGKNPKAGYKAVSRVLGKLPDSNIWSESACTEESARLLELMSWVETYESLEELCAMSASVGAGYSAARVHDSVNDALARSGLAYEMRAGRFVLFDAEASSLGLQGSESEALVSLTDEFAAVRKQYAKAVEKMNARPSDLEGAVADALNAMEAVVAIATSGEGKTLGDLVKRLFADGEGYHKPLRSAITSLYAYSNGVPGARHGRYAEPIIAAAETAMVLRVVGALISFIITDYRVGPLVD